MFEILIKLLFAHAVGDFALQSETMAYGKNRHNQPKNVPAGQKMTPTWYWWLSAPALTNGAVYYLLTGLLWIGILEAVIHFFLDLFKIEGYGTPTTDQIRHLLFIGFYWLIILRTV